MLYLGRAGPEPRGTALYEDVLFQELAGMEDKKSTTCSLQDTEPKKPMTQFRYREADGITP